MQNFNHQEFHLKFQKSSSAKCLLDVRTVEEVSAGSLPGSVHIPVQELAARLGELPKADEYYVYCRSGGRSQAAAQLIEEHFGEECCINAQGCGYEKLKEHW